MNEISIQECKQYRADRIRAAEQGTLALQFKTPRKWSPMSALRATFAHLSRHASPTTGRFTQGTVVPR